MIKELEELMGKMAAIDIGSNAIRLVMAKTKGTKHYQVLKKVRVPLRLGAEAFSKKEFTASTLDYAESVFSKFKTLLEHENIHTYLAVATSAFRESKNSTLLKKKILKEYGLDIRIIEGSEEAALIMEAVKQGVSLKNKEALLIDIGGGSVELTLVKNEKVLTQKSFDVGTIRCLQLSKQKGARALEQFLRSQKEEIMGFLSPHLSQSEKLVVVGTGGNLRRLGKLKRRVLGKKEIDHITPAEIDKIYSELSPLSPLKRAKKYKLKRDRADVIVPAIEILKTVIDGLPVKQILLPNVGLADGLLYRMILGQDGNFLH